MPDRPRRPGGALLPLVTLALALAVLSVAPSVQGDDAIGLRAALARARALGLAQSIEWQRVVHYRPGFWGSLVSDIDGGAFFVSAAGKRDPSAELEATLAAFFAPIVPGREDAHALCRFPARRRWLDERLGLPAAMHAPACPALRRYRELLDPAAVSLVYVSNYLGNPGSALGHTFLRIHKRRGLAETTPSEQLDHTVEYVADTDTTNPVLYAAKGLSGMFSGHVEFRSYASKAREYGTIEGRDLWEYRLALTQPEQELLVLHLWELVASRADYFYLSQNCAYHILGALEAAAPRIDVLSGSNALLLPTDTVKAIAAIPGLVTDVRYRPADRKRARAASRPTPWEKSPARGHGSMRVTVGGGATTQYDEGFATLGFRMSLHDLADPPDGHPELLQLQFLDARVGYRLVDHALYLDSVTFAELLALKPLTSPGRGLSWRVRGYGVRLHDAGCDDCFAHGPDVSLGASLASEDERAAAFLMADTYVLFGDLDGIGGSFVRVGVGPYGGVRLRLAPRTVAVVTTSVSYLPAQRPSFTYDARAIFRGEVAEDVALGVEADLQPAAFGGQLAAYLYF